MRRSFRLHVYGYVVMPEHVHLLLSEPQQDTLADALKSLKQGVSRRLIGDAEHFWQKRYYDFDIRNYPQFVEKLPYIHRNRGPQQARLWLAGVESRKARVMRASRGLAVEQFSPLRHRL
jgi:REP element-mobilizing transposase RayT